MELINENLIEIDTPLATRQEIVAHLAQMLQADGRLVDPALYIKDVHLREEEGSTAMGFSVAIPHAKSESVRVSSLAFLRLKTPVRWNEEEEVKYVFGIAVPKANQGNEHLEILAMLARKMIHDEYLEELANANTKAEYLKLILG